MAHHLGLTGSNLWNPIFSPSPSPLNCFEYSCTTLVPSDPEPTYSSSNASASPHHETCCISRNLACDQRAARHVAELDRGYRRPLPAPCHALVILEPARSRTGGHAPSPSLRPAAHTARVQRRRRPGTSLDDPGAARPPAVESDCAAAAAAAAVNFTPISSPDYERWVSEQVCE